MHSEDSLNVKRSTKKRVTVPKWTGLLFIVGIIFISTNLRAPLTSVGPLVGTIRDDLQLSNALAGMMTTLPLLAFAFFSPFVPKLSRRFGAEGIILISTIFLTVGIVLRSLSSVVTLYIGIAVLGLAIAICNVLLPSLIKREFPERIGLMTGVYSISMNLFGAVASGLSVPLAIGAGLGWQKALGIWAVLSFFAFLFWMPQMKFRKENRGKVKEVESSAYNLWKSPLAWQVTLFMGLQSSIFYVLVAWLPEILMSRGVVANQAGWMLSVMQLSLLPFTFIVPIIAGRMTNQRSLVVTTFSLLFTGSLGLIYGAISLTILWIIFLGIGAGFAFSLSMMFFGLRTDNSRQAAELSGMAQSLGYLLAAIGPTLFGYLHDKTDGWTLPLFILVGISVLILIFGLGASRNKTVSEDAPLSQS